MTDTYSGLNLKIGHKHGMRILVYLFGVFSLAWCSFNMKKCFLFWQNFCLITCNGTKPACVGQIGDAIQIEPVLLCFQSWFCQNIRHCTIWPKSIGQMSFSQPVMVISVGQNVRTNKLPSSIWLTANTFSLSLSLSLSCNCQLWLFFSHFESKVLSWLWDWL